MTELEWFLGRTFDLCGMDLPVMSIDQASQTVAFLVAGQIVNVPLSAMLERRHREVKAQSK